MNEKVVLITGAGKRVGACVAEALHQAGWRVIIHYRQSSEEAQTLIERLNEQRAHSAVGLQADLSDANHIRPLADSAAKVWGRIDALINNASSFYPTPLATATETEWNDLFSSNVKAPFFLAQALLSPLKINQGCIINMVDIHANNPIPEHPIYCMAKAALVMMTKSLAKDLGPDIRVNAIAPGIILWPDAPMPEKVKTGMINKTPLKRAGEPLDVANAILFLLQQPYITGHILNIDGGRSLA